MTAPFHSLQNYFLLATPELGDTLFYRSVIYICEHTQEGAMGLIINRPLDIHLNTILEKMEYEIINPAVYHEPVYLGGPLQTSRGFVLHRSDPLWDDSVEVAPGLCITASKDILESICSGDGPKETFVALGYSAWGKGQLEEEIVDNAWLTVEATPEIIFSTPIDKKWHKAYESLGGVHSALMGQVGHA